MLDCWQRSHVFLHGEYLLFLLPLQDRTLLRGMKGKHLRNYILVSSIDIDVTVDIVQPIEVLE
jgi:hypothetical protein